jgi:hypothetical protein
MRLGGVWTLPRSRGGASVLTSHSRVPRLEPVPIGIGVGIGIGIEPERPSIPMPTAKRWLDGVSPHRFWDCVGMRPGAFGTGFAIADPGRAGMLADSYPELWRSEKTSLERSWNC